MNKRKRIFTYCSLVCVQLGLIPVYAADFYTIIGPDGRPMIVQQREEKPVREISKPKNSVVPETSINNQGKNQESSPKTLVPKVEKNAQAVAKDQPKSLHAEEAEQHPAQLKESKPIRQKHAPPENRDSLKQSIDDKKVDRLSKQLETTKKDFDPIRVKERDQTIQNSANVTPSNQDSSENLAEHKIASREVITKIDGVEYVDNEYLEDREFNLEGKKRFYIMPDSSVGGTRRFETVEREKGISKSVFSKLTKSPSLKSEPVVLASTYYRLPKNEVVQSLEQGCFQGKKMSKAKLLSLDKNEMGLWPVPPIKEQFAYDVIKLDKPVENIHFTSYASSQKSPSYYWPLVVFLDQQGCVIEGVSGFKNENINSTSTSYSALEGVLKKPPNAVYLFMTPLSEAVDVQNVQLTNKGQIKLSVLR